MPEASTIHFYHGTNQYSATEFAGKVENLTFAAHHAQQMIQ